MAYVTTSTSLRCDGSTAKMAIPAAVPLPQSSLGSTIRNGKAYVGTGANQVPVGVVRPQGGSAYLRTYADGQWNNNLLSLDTF